MIMMFMVVRSSCRVSCVSTCYKQVLAFAELHKPLSLTHLNLDPAQIWHVPRHSSVDSATKNLQGPNAMPSITIDCSQK